MENKMLNIDPKYKVLDGFTLKMIAIITMLIDHVGHVIFPEIAILRIIGRFSFPIFCFLLVEGFFHTSNVKKYMFRLFGAAIISEIPYNLCMMGRVWYQKEQNVMFTLFLGLVLIYLFEQFESRLYRIVFFILICMITYILNPDYSVFGIFMIFAFYYLKSNDIYKIAVIAIMNFYAVWWGHQAYATLALIPIYLYNGKRGMGGKGVQYFFYIFYPLHMVIIFFIKKNFFM